MSLYRSVANSKFVRHSSLALRKWLHSCIYSDSEIIEWFTVESAMYVRMPIGNSVQCVDSYPPRRWPAPDSVPAPRSAGFGVRAARIYKRSASRDRKGVGPARIPVGGEPVFYSADGGPSARGISARSPEAPLLIPRMVFGPHR